MSVIWSNEDGWILCHSQHLHEIYRDFENKTDFCSSCRKHQIFHIHAPFLKHGQKQKLVNMVYNYPDDIQLDNLICKLGDYSEDSFKTYELTILPQIFGNFMHRCAAQNLDYFSKNCDKSQGCNLPAIEAAKVILRSDDGRLPKSYNGGNLNDKATAVKLENETYFVPPNCRFYNCDINDIRDKFERNFQLYDFILIDPPWQNKHVKRKNASSKYQGYNLMSTDHFAQLPVSEFLNADGLVAVWCTNSSLQINHLINKTFPAWNIRYICTWFWIKVTEYGQPICAFSTQENKKQPFERIIFGSHIDRVRKYKNPQPNKIIVSVPSSIHSHKPPLTDIIKEYLPSDSRCVEFFARYLLPNWTSCGDEVLKLQHQSLFR